MFYFEQADILICPFVPGIFSIIFLFVSFWSISPGRSRRLNALKDYLREGGTITVN